MHGSVISTQLVPQLPRLSNVNGQFTAMPVMTVLISGRSLFTSFAFLLAHDKHSGSAAVFLTALLPCLC